MQLLGRQDAVRKNPTEAHPGGALDLHRNDLADQAIRGGGVDGLQIGAAADQLAGMATGPLEQHRQGEMTRQLASWAAILAVPTAIAGIYGMNFEFMPELHWRYGYFGALGLIVTVCWGLWWRFKRIGWL